MKINEQVHRRKKVLLRALQDSRQPWWQHWRDCADYYLPRRYTWLLSPTERQRRLSRNTLILDPTGTMAARTLASGMMNGVTSPSRPWFKLRLAGGFDDDDDFEANVWLDETTRRIALAMAETNFYNSMAVMYLDLAVFGTAANLIFEDFDSVFRCYNPPLGEYYIAHDARQIVDTFARQFVHQVHQCVPEYGLENVRDQVKAWWNQGGQGLMQDINIAHLVEPNVSRDDEPALPGGWKYREYYWDDAAPDGEILRQAGYNELPGIFPRWDLTGNDAYGTSPAMDALPDVIQLQHETKKKAQGLDKLVDPPLMADITLANKPVSTLPRGMTFVAGLNNGNPGVKPIYTVQLPLDQLTMDIQDVQTRVREAFYNDLFKMISQLDTVRSATEIDARREEKLVLLGPVLERFENEALDPAIRRIFAIMYRAGLLPEAPESLQDKEIEIQYVSILTAAQTAVSTIPTERLIGFVGAIAPVYPKALNIPDFEEIIRGYGRDLGTPAKYLRPREDVAQDNTAQDQLAATREEAATGEVLVNSAKALSETDVGGGANALSRLINPFGTG